MFFARTVTLWWVVILGILTILTHISQVISLRFNVYANIVFYSALILTAAWGIACCLNKAKRIDTFDWKPFFLLLLTCVGSGVITVFSQPEDPFGQASQDELVYLSGLIYYLKNPLERLTYEVHYLYSGMEPFHSVSYFVNGAYQLVQAAFSYVLGIYHITFFFGIVSFLAGFALPLSIYLLLGRFSEKTMSIAMGTFATFAVILLLDEKVITPGGWIFQKVFMGKSIIVSTGVCLFTCYSLEYFLERSLARWMQLFMLLTCLIGMSTTTIMIFPIMAAILFLAYYIVAKQEYVDIIALFKKGIIYVASFAYLGAYAVYISLTDSVGGAQYANQNFPHTMYGYITGYLWDKTFPITPITFVLFSFLAILLARSEMRRFVTGMIFLPLLILNPWVSEFLLQFFMGVYVRIFYITPIFLVIGYTFSRLFEYTQKRPGKLRWVWTCFAALLFGMYVTLPSSNFKTVKSHSAIFSGKNYLVAQSVINETPRGIMLAPYPISSTIFAFAADYPQIIDRPVITQYFLWTQGREAEALLRIKASNFMFGNPPKDNSGFDAFITILDAYPEIKSVVIRNKTLNSVPELPLMMKERGFKYSRVVEKIYTVFWK